MKRYVVVGNCQARGVGRCLQFYAPEHEVAVVPLWELGQNFPDRASCLEYLKQFDVVFLQGFGPGYWSHGTSDTIAEAVKRTVYFPSITFAAYHPDIVYVVHKKARSLLTTPMGDYHSALTLFGYLKGYSAERTVSLFERSVFQRLGYLDLWKTSSDELLRSPEAESYQLASRIIAWSRRGSFMNSSVHPKIAPLLDITKKMLILAGEDVCDEDGNAFVRDDLLDAAVWPLYPAVAERYGLSGGGYTFKRNTYDADKRWPEWLTLPAFVQGSYDCYEALGKENIECSRVEQWIANGTL